MLPAIVLAQAQEQQVLLPMIKFFFQVTTPMLLTMLLVWSGAGVITDPVPIIFLFAYEKALDILPKGF